jgi:hypothetical protein
MIFLYARVSPNGAAASLASAASVGTRTATLTASSLRDDRKPTATATVVHTYRTWPHAPAAAFQVEPAGRFHMHGRLRNEHGSALHRNAVPVALLLRLRANRSRSARSAVVRDARRAVTGITQESKGRCFTTTAVWYGQSLARKKEQQRTMPKSDMSVVATTGEVHCRGPPTNLQPECPCMRTS